MAALRLSAIDGSFYCDDSYVFQNLFIIMFHYSTKQLFLLHIFLLYHKYYCVDMFYTRSSQYETVALHFLFLQRTTYQVFF